MLGLTEEEKNILLAFRLQDDLKNRGYEFCKIERDFYGENDLSWSLYIHYENIENAAVLDVIHINTSIGIIVRSLKNEIKKDKRK